MSIAARRGLAALAIVGVLAGSAGCGAPHATPGSATPPRVFGVPAGVSGTVTVFAAASLTEVFTTLGRQFEAAHPGVRVRFNFGGSSGLARQITAGAPADVFAAANEKTMRQASALVAGAPVVFAHNRLAIAVPPANPAKVTGLADLGRAGVKVALCAPQVPCGEAASAVERAAKVNIRPVTQEQDVKAALAKVRLGEVDAALVYRTDVKSAGPTVSGIDFPESARVVNAYPVAALTRGPNPAAGRAFADYVLSAPARAALSAAGFDSS